MPVRPLNLLLWLAIVLPAQADDQGIPYTQTPAGGEEEPPFQEIAVDRIDQGPTTFVEVPVDQVDRAPDNFVEIAPDRFSEGSRHGRWVYREMDHDDFDNEPMVETLPARDPALHPLPPAVIPARSSSALTVVVPPDAFTVPEPTAEDRIFETLYSHPDSPGRSPEVPPQQRIYIPPDILRSSD